MADNVFASMQEADLVLEPDVRITVRDASKNGSVIGHAYFPPALAHRSRGQKEHEASFTDFDRGAWASVEKDKLHKTMLRRYEKVCLINLS